MAAKPLVYVGTTEYVAKVDSANNDFGYINLGGDSEVTVFGITGDPSGYIYFVGTPDQNTGYSLWKYHRDGQLVWAAAHGGTLYGVTVDSSGNVYVCGQAANGTEMFYSGSRTGFYTTRKYDPAGTLLWSVDGEPTAQDGANYNVDLDIELDSSGNVLVASLASDVGTYGGLRQHDPDTGELIWRWTYDEPCSVTRVTSDASGNAYCNGADGIVKIDSSGELVWANDLEQGQKINDLKWQGNKVIALLEWFDYFAWPGCMMRVDDSTGTPEVGWPSANIAYNRFNRMDVDSDGNLYFAGVYGRYKYSNAGSQIWFDGIVSSLQSICVIETETPALKIPLAFGVPTLIGDLYTLISALPIALSLSAPKTRLEYVSPDRLPSVYRVYLSGTPDLELTVSSFSCRRSDGGIVLSLSCPVADSVTVDDILDRADGDLVVKAGVRFRDGVEQVSEVLRAGYSSLRWNEGTATATLALEGKTDGIAEDPKTRALSGIAAYRISDGVREAECSVDFYLEPGDTADLGDGETFIVGQIIYAVSPTRAYMTVSEIPP